MNFTNKTLFHSTIICIALLAHGSASAQSKPVELRFAHWVPATHILVKSALEPWAKSVETASKGSIKVVLYPAQQLGKAVDHYDMARTGVADLAWVSPGYQPGRFPIFSVADIPMLINNGVGGSQAVDAWYRGYADKEMKDIHFCLAHVHIGSIHSRKPVRSPADLKGLKVRPSSGAVAQTMTVLGATNVQLSAVDARDAIDRGLADMLTFPWSALVNFGIDKATKFHIDMPFNTGNFVWAMNKRWYSSLDASQKAVIDSHCSNEWALKAGGDYAKAEDAGREQLLKNQGHTFIKLEASEIDAWKKAVEPVTKAWAQDIQKIGENPDEVLSKLKQELSRRNSLY